MRGALAQSLPGNFVTRGEFQVGESPVELEIVGLHAPAQSTYFEAGRIAGKRHRQIAPEVATFWCAGRRGDNRAGGGHAHLHIVGCIEARKGGGERRRSRGGRARLGLGGAQGNPQEGADHGQHPDVSRPFVLYSHVPSLSCGRLSHVS